MRTAFDTTDSVRERTGLLPGDKAGPWLVEHELGRGGMGSVYAVVHETIGKRAALKVLHEQWKDPQHADRILLEARVVNQVDHPGIVDIFETGLLPDGRAYIVMERLEGVPLFARAHECKLMPDTVIEILLQTCDALIAAHAAGIIHRDLKPDNLFLVEHGELPHKTCVKLLDWGIAKVIATEVRCTLEGQLVGTPQYLSPEQARGADVTVQSDVYSLGVMAYELFLEQLPFEADTAAEILAMHLRDAPPAPHELWPDIPVALEQLLLAMLAKRPDRRPTMPDVVRALESVRRELGARVGRVPSAALALALSQIALVDRAGHLGNAPTEELASRRRAPRWQYAIGAFAVSALALMFAVSRISDSDAHTMPTTTAATVTQVPAPTPIATVTVGEPELLPATATPDVVRAALPQKRTLSGARARKPHAPAVPRRAARFDPDGTLDAYR